MDFEISVMDATSFLQLINSSTPNDLTEKANAYIQTNISELRRILNSKNDQDEFEHLVVFARTKANEIVGFRYFFFKPSNSFCHMFATYVDKPYRRLGIASSMIERAFDLAASRGCNEFKVVLTEQSIEKDGLFEWYRRYAKTKADKFKFTIQYWSKIEKYGYI